jgi:outer membrane protein, multidrug efflux system
MDFARHVGRGLRQGREVIGVAQKMRTTQIAALMCLGLLMAGCAVGPDYVPPKPSAPSKFAEESRQGIDAHAPPDDPWWRNLGDPILEDLLMQALKSAPDVAEAQARVREARALSGIAGAGQFPVVNADGQYDRTLGSENVPLGLPPGGLGPGEHGNVFQAGFDASWEIDIFGGQRRAIEAANADYAAVIEDRSNVVLTLLAEIARDYVQLRGAQRRIELARKNLAIEQDLESLTRSQLDAGLAPRQDMLRAQAQVSDVQAAIPALETDERTAAYRIAALTAQPFTEIVGKLSVPRPIPQALSDVPVGLPSELLRRRPDIRAAERRIAAANARIGVAQADLYPHFSLTGAAGLESLNLSSFSSASSGYYQIGPNFRWMIFDAGRVRFQIQAESARTAAATAIYERSVLGALCDVEAALVSYANTQMSRDKFAAESAEDREAVDIARLLYERGVESFLPVLDAERSLYAADDKLAQSERDATLALVALYKSLGGGWQTANAGMSEHSAAHPAK